MSAPDTSLRHQADGVFQGGGVKGIALAGALEELADEAAHPDDYVGTWVNLAGTSAGAIVAAYLACGHSVADTASLVAGTDFGRFEDWGPGGAIIGGGLNLARHHGLAHGKVFRDWFAKQVADKTFADVAETGRTLKLIASDITRREMLVLPDSLSNYELSARAGAIVPADFPIADAVRMSMSIPYFFQPIELIHLETGQPSTIVDGGVLSNFPVWIFDVEDQDPKRPTFGFKLVSGQAVGGEGVGGPGMEGVGRGMEGVGRGVGGHGVGAGLETVIHAFGWPVQMGVDIFHTATDAWDKHWVSRATRVRTCPISSLDVGTTDFKLSEERKQALVASGRQAMRQFLADWDRAQYTNSNGRSLVPAS